MIHLFCSPTGCNAVPHSGAASIVLQRSDSASLLGMLNIVKGVLLPHAKSYLRNGLG